MREKERCYGVRKNQASSAHLTGKEEEKYMQQPKVAHTPITRPTESKESHQKSRTCLSIAQQRSVRSQPKVAHMPHASRLLDSVFQTDSELLRVQSAEYVPLASL